MSQFTYEKQFVPSGQPLGHNTRGKTKKNRLRRTDIFLRIYSPTILKLHESNIFLDLGYGETPVTTIESMNSFQEINPNLKTIGVEIDKDRVEYAQSFANESLEFRHGGFNLPLKDHEKCCFIRAFNVLRQYDTSAVKEAYNILSRYIVDGGILMEGTSDPFGRYWTANILRKKNDALEQESLVFSTNFKEKITPKDFQTVLPKQYIECMTEPHAIYDFFIDWNRFYQECICYEHWGSKQVFIHSVQKLALANYPVLLRKRLISRGYVVVHNHLKNRKKIL